ncbi:MAG: histidinol-phosphate transaminase [Halothiobacillaceae bacterium]|nr:histidinol-phosphate transaminase [Halothiobacillaceae bacterium]
MSLIELALPNIQRLAPYVPGKPIEELERELGITDILKLASNENPLGASQRARAAIDAALHALALYPDGSGFRLRQAIARRQGLSAEGVTLGNGSNDVLDLIARAYLGPGREAVFSEHAFAVYPIATQSVGADARVARAHGMDHPMPYGSDPQALADAVGPRTRVLFVANPNNPTGTWIGREALRALLDAVPAHVLVVVDEAYTDYVEDPDFPDAAAWLPDYPNLIVTRTFSKIHGLAALRVGYALSHPSVADALNRVRQPFNVNTLALIAAEAALEDTEHLQRSRELNTRGLAQLKAAFAERGLGYIPSVANFLTVDVARPAQPVFEALLREGVIVRPVANYGLPNHLRVTIGRAQENARFLTALDKVLGL